jgi:hypothetical protein
MDWKLWVCIGVIVVLIGGTGYLAYAYIDKSGDLTEANSTIDDYIDEVADLEQDVTGLTDDLIAMDSEMDDLEDEKVDLENELDDANSEISSLESDLSSKTDELNSEKARTISLQGELNTVMYPRHFSSLQELRDWLEQDDTEDEWSHVSCYAELCYILQARAIQDGYILSTDVDFEDGVDYWSNCAVIGDTIYWIYPDDDDIETAGYSDWFEILPSHPIPQGE